MRDLLLWKIVRRVSRLDSLLRRRKLLRTGLLGAPDFVDISRVFHPPNEQLHISRYPLENGIVYGTQFCSHISP